MKTTFSLADYDSFRFGWKIEGEEDGWSNSLIFRVDNAPTDFHVLLRPLSAEITSAQTDASGGDEYGEFRADGWFTADTRLWRRLVLLAEGTLVVCDRLEPGKTADGWQAGPLWHLPAVRQVSANAFDAAGRENLLVWFAPSPGRRYGVQSKSLWSGVKPFTAYAAETLRSGRPVEFVSVLAPHGGEETAEKLAAGMDVSLFPDGVTRIKLPGRAGLIEV